jgi:hypothetical protein
MDDLGPRQRQALSSLNTEIPAEGVCQAAVLVQTRTWGCSLRVELVIGHLQTCKPAIGSTFVHRLSSFVHRLSSFVHRLSSVTKRRPP